MVLVALVQTKGRDAVEVLTKPFVCTRAFKLPKYLILLKKFVFVNVTKARVFSFIRGFIYDLFRGLIIALIIRLML